VRFWSDSAALYTGNIPYIAKFLVPKVEILLINSNRVRCQSIILFYRITPVGVHRQKETASPAGILISTRL
jgi:hypothetical protein